MEKSKKEQFSEDFQVIARFAKALSHPARVAILETLAEKNSCICGEIVEVMPLSQSTVSQHLKELRDAGIIKGTIQGTSSCYYIDYDNLKKNIESLNNLINKLVADSEGISCEVDSTCCK